LEQGYNRLSEKEGIIDLFACTLRMASGPLSW